MIALLTGLALAMPQHREVDLTLGMRAGVAGQWTVEPTSRVELGGRLTAETDVYAGAPDWVREGLDPKHNLHFTPMGLVGVNTGDTAVSGAFSLGLGTELFTFREAKTLPSVAETVVYGATGLRPAAAMLFDLRIRGAKGVGGHLLFSLPLPFAPTGAPYIDRLHLAAGVVF
ncbi:MAG: hypothetical protein EP330_07240 [Deltaproteobacteria bacterium]|nr:MAG: hypothetical protein EP330_07240 [Deltaproteobacteria bacterium]